jgi:hypothetical protein
MNARILKLVAGGAVLSLLAGCIVMSVYPFYTPKDLIFDPGLAGSWGKTGTTNELWRFAVSGEKAYLLGVVDDSETNSFEAHLFRLKRYQFLDLLTTNRAAYELPVHLISKVNQRDTNLSLQFLDYGWLAGLLATNPAVLRHIMVPARPEDTNDDMVYLTADTRDLQAFLLKHAADTNAFTTGSAVNLKLISR